MKKIFILFAVLILMFTGLMAQELTLTWVNSISEGVTGYNLYRSETPGGEYFKVNPVLIPPNATSVLNKSEFTDITVKYNKRYYYVCRAVVEWEDPVNGSGILESINSNEATEYIMPPAPNPPSGLIKKILQALGMLNPDGTRKVFS